jgi:hypothetical protein
VLYFLKGFYFYDWLNAQLLIVEPVLLINFIFVMILKYTIWEFGRYRPEK